MWRVFEGGRDEKGAKNGPLGIGALTSYLRDWVGLWSDPLVSMGPGSWGWLCEAHLHDIGLRRGL